MSKKWYFDNYPRKDQRKSWVQIADTENGMCLDIYVNDQKVLSIDGELDQWGTWIGFEVSAFTVAQEWSTKSFVQALMAALTEFSKICDLEGNVEKQKPEYEELSLTVSEQTEPG